MKSTLFISIFVSVKLYDHNSMPFIVAVSHYTGILRLLNASM